MLDMWLRIGAINGFLVVAGGAIASHALRSHLTPEAMNTFEIGLRYHMLHALALLAVALVARHTRSPMVPAAGWCFSAGIVLFSGSLYVLALSGIKWLGMITPFGGMAFLLGWLALTLVPIRSRSRRGT